MKTNILFLGQFSTKDIIHKYSDWCLDPYKVSEFLITGFRLNKDVKIEVITSPDLPSWPHFPLFFLKGHYDASFDTRVVSSLNVSFVKQIWTIITMFFASANIIRKNGKEKTNIIIPYMVFRHVFVLWLLNCFFSRRVNSIIIIEDIFFPKKRIHQLFNRMTECMARSFDAFILYTQAMASYLRIENKPYIIMEGVIDLKSFPQLGKYENKKNVILYTGALHPCHDVMKLFEIMRIINRDDVELWITGRGPLAEEIKKLAEKDNRITFWGTVEKRKVFELQAQADILINPRSDIGNDNITRYMFPSKVLEYMYSGNPSVVCRMSGIPEDYYEYLVVPESNSVESISAAVLSILNWPKNKRNSFGKRAKNFVSTKNAQNQSNRIINLIHSL